MAKRWNSIIGGALSGVLAFGLASGGAQAGDADSLTTWKDDAGRHVSDHMAWPRQRHATGDSHNTVELIIDRSGRILEAAMVRRSTQRAFDRQTERSLEEMKAMPALPAGFAGDRARVVLHMVYATSPESAERILRAIERRSEPEQRVRIRQIAALPLIELAAVR